MNRRPLIAVYIVASRYNGTIYTGVTSNLTGRIHQHREGLLEGFSKRYGCKHLVWWEPHPDMPSAIAREKVIKHWGRRRKERLIEEQNPRWDDLYPSLIGAHQNRRAFERLTEQSAQQPSPKTSSLREARGSMPPPHDHLDERSERPVQGATNPIASTMDPRATRKDDGRTA